MPAQPGNEQREILADVQLGIEEVRAPDSTVNSPPLLKPVNCFKVLLPFVLWRSLESSH